MSAFFNGGSLLSGVLLNMMMFTIDYHYYRRKQLMPNYMVRGYNLTWIRWKSSIVGMSPPPPAVRNKERRQQAGWENLLNDAPWVIV